MKTLKMFGIALMAVLVCLNLTSCNKEDNPITPEGDEYVTVGIGVTGEYLEISDTPLGTRATTTADTYGINVYAVAENGNETLYATGCFTSLSNLKVKLLQNQKYRFEVGIGVDDNFIEGGYYSTFFGEYIGADFDYTPTSDISLRYLYDYKHDYFYGELWNYTPSVDGSIEIETKRVVYGAHYIAEGLTEGSLTVKINREYGSSLYSEILTPEEPESDKIYMFSRIWDAWNGLLDVESGVIYNYSTTKLINITWTKDDGSSTPIGTYAVTFKRNIKTTIRIKLEDLGLQNGIVITREDTPMSGDDNEYVIEGGEITEVPVTTE